MGREKNSRMNRQAYHAMIRFFMFFMLRIMSQTQHTLDNLSRLSAFSQITDVINEEYIPWSTCDNDWLIVKYHRLLCGVIFRFD